MKLAAVRAGALMSQAGATARAGPCPGSQAGRPPSISPEQVGGPPVSGGGTLVTVEFTPDATRRGPLALSSAVLRDAATSGGVAGIDDGNRTR
jgi:hypothetical protein